MQREFALICRVPPSEVWSRRVYKGPCQLVQSAILWPECRQLASAHALRRERSISGRTGILTSSVDNKKAYPFRCLPIFFPGLELTGWNITDTGSNSGLEGKDARCFSRNLVFSFMYPARRRTATPLEYYAHLCDFTGYGSTLWKLTRHCSAGQKRTNSTYTWLGKQCSGCMIVSSYWKSPARCVKWGERPESNLRKPYEQ